MRPVIALFFALMMMSALVCNVYAACENGGCYRKCEKNQQIDHNSYCGGGNVCCVNKGDGGW
ncbi:hypothetical protein AALO_G00028810 [Alosa alosa]|uniref:Beta-defensin n=1 Tax=Alosa alosa TaxID=278164 RepID=A0AAV6HGK2_9TELE|nr:hypothetical protein AALO_G00028810 [Alosa alosa]